MSLQFAWRYHSSRSPLGKKGNVPRCDNSKQHCVQRNRRDRIRSTLPSRPTKSQLGKKSEEKREQVDTSPFFRFLIISSIGEKKLPKAEISRGGGEKNFQEKDSISGAPLGHQKCCLGTESGITLQELKERGGDEEISLGGGDYSRAIVEC